MLVIVLLGGRGLARPGRRRREVRAIGIGIVVTGVLLLVIRSVAGNYIVDKVVVTESVKPAVDQVWEIITDSLAASAWNAICRRPARGPRRLAGRAGQAAVAARRELAPRLRRPEVAWPVFAVLLVAAALGAPDPGLEERR